LSSDGRITPVEFDSNNAKKDGRVVGASGYDSMEHYTLLLPMESTPDSFHSSESSPEWKALYDKMLVDYYNKYNVTPKESMALQKHFMEFYSAFKNVVRALSLQPGSPTLPTECTDEDYLNDYVQALLKILFNTPKVPKKWWSEEVVTKLLQLHQTHSSAFGQVQDNKFLQQKRKETKTKFDQDQKNREVEFARKRQLEDNERKEAARNRKIVAEQSVHVADCTPRISDCMEHLVTNNQQEMSKVVDDKLNNLKTEMFSTMNTKLDSFLNQIGQMLNHGNNNSN
jgi:hypothetical protein